MPIARDQKVRKRVFSQFQDLLYAYLYVISPRGYGAGFTINIRNPAVQKNPPIRGRICERRILRPDENLNLPNFAQNTIRIYMYKHDNLN